MARTGRPKKVINRRAITAHIDEHILSMIDMFVAEKKQMNREYSRSDFFNEATRKFFADLKRKGYENDGHIK